MHTLHAGAGALFTTTAAAIGLLSGASLARADIVTIEVTFDTPDAAPAYRLTGQSSFFVNQTDSLTTGGQLDWVESPGAVIQYEELFPPASLNDYLTFGYFGRIETLDDNGDALSTAFVMAFRPGLAAGAMIEDFFPGFDAADLALALETHDSQQFLDLLSIAPQTAATVGDIALPDLARPGDTLHLIAFFGGTSGLEGVHVGTISTSIVLPAPGAAALPLALAITALRRRRVR